MRFVIVLLFCLIGPSVAAHSLGVSLERTVGEYWIDIGYEPSQPFGGDRMVFDFNLADAAATSTTVEFDYVWVRLQSSEGTLLASGIHRAPIGPTTLLIMLPKDTKGDMHLSVRFQKDDDTLAESEFTIPVTPYEEPRWWMPFVAAAFAGVVVGSLTILMWKRRIYTSDILET